MIHSELFQTQTSRTDSTARLLVSIEKPIQSIRSIRLNMNECPLASNIPYT